MGFFTHGITPAQHSTVLHLLQSSSITVFGLQMGFPSLLAAVGSSSSKEDVAPIHLNMGMIGKTSPHVSRVAPVLTPSLATAMINQSISMTLRALPGSWP